MIDSSGNSSHMLLLLTLTIILDISPFTEILALGLNHMYHTHIHIQTHVHGACVYVQGLGVGGATSPKGTESPV